MSFSSFYWNRQKQFHHFVYYFTAFPRKNLGNSRRIDIKNQEFTVFSSFEKRVLQL